MTSTIIPEPFGPTYPDLGAGVAKYRRKANQVGSIKKMLRADVVAYADAIEKAIRAKHRTLHMRPTPSVNGDWYSPPSVTRLLRYENPIKMQGDPKWDGDDKDACKWGKRERVVYEAMMHAKRSDVLPLPPY